MYRRINVAEGPLVRGKLAVRVHVPLAGHEQELLLGKIRIDDGEREPRAFGEPCNRDAVGQSHRVEHEFESDLGTRHLALF